MTPQEVVAKIEKLHENNVTIESLTYHPHEENWTSKVWLSDNICVDLTFENYLELPDVIADAIEDYISNYIDF